MKVLHIITGLDDGGAEAVLYRLVTHDTDHQHEIISLTTNGKYFAMLQRHGIPVTSLGMAQGKISVSRLFRLWKLILSSQANVVQTWMYHADLIGGFIARIARIPVVWGIRNTALEPERSSRSTILAARLCARLSRWVPKSIVVCAQGAAIAHQEMGYDNKRMVILPNGYDVSKFTPDIEARRQLRSEWGIADQQLLIGMVARFDPYKDHANLLSALQILSHRSLNLKCILIGTGMNRTNASLMTLLDTTNLSSQISLLGPQSDIPAVMNALDIHVLSSSSEAFPNVLAEAMACGTPCVTTDVGDAALIVGETGWIVPAQNAEALADGLSQAVQAGQDSESWPERQEQCRTRIVETFGMKRMLAGYHQVWKEATSK